MKRRAFLISAVFAGIFANPGRVSAKSNVQRSPGRLNALVIGISYSRAERRFHLRNTLSDARAISDFLALDPLRKVSLVENANVKELRSAVSDYFIGLGREDVALIYYAGHAVQIENANYILSDDAEALVPIADIVLKARQRSKVVILFLDACRDNPFAAVTDGTAIESRSITKMVSIVPETAEPNRHISDPEDTISSIPLDSPALSSTNGLAQFRLQGPGVKVVFATDPGNVALDRVGTVKNSPFTRALVRQLREPKSLDEVLAEVTKEVVGQTGGAQTPWAQGSLEETIFISGRPSRYNAGDVRMPLP